MAIGAHFNDGNGSDSGHVRVYSWNGSSHVQRGNDIDGEFGDDNSGVRISLSGDGSVVAVGARLNDGNGTTSGHVRVYFWNGTSHVQRGNDIDGESSNDQLGFTVSLSGNGSVLAVGAPNNDGSGGNAGHVRVYFWNGTSHVQRGNDIDGESGGDRSGQFAGDQSGWSVSLSNDGNVLAIGAPNNDGNGGNAGHVRVYSWNGTSHVKRGNDIDGELAYDLLGFTVSLSGNGSILAIGAPYNGGNGNTSGHVRVYSWNGSSHVQRGNDIDGEFAGDQSGWSVSLSNDGNVLAIGAPNNDGNSSDSGHVRAYSWNGSSHVQRGNDIDGESGGDRSGHSVSLSGDGNVLAIGATHNGGNGNTSGHVRVYSWNG